jgi:hypothetical protein
MDHTQNPAGEPTASATLGAAGVTLPSGQIVSETARLVHLFPIRTGQTIPDGLCVFCGLGDPAWSG